MPTYAANNDAIASIQAKKKRNRKKKNKDGSGKLTAEEIHKMPTEDLCEYIENKENENNNLVNNTSLNRQLNKPVASTSAKKKSANLSMDEQNNLRNIKKFKDQIRDFNNQFTK